MVEGGESSRRKKCLFLHGGTSVAVLFNLLENSGGRNMKKLSVLAVALSVATLGIPIFAYGQPQEMKQEEQKPKLMDIKGTVKADGDKITFVTDAEGKSWDVVNPETLKDHVGHHVEVSAHVYTDKGQIHVMKVTMLKQ
jgi:membrane protein implicated in regulation of membrane protease activity